MPNWCLTNYVAKSSDTKQLKKLYNIMDRLQKMSEPLVENGFGPTWLGCLVKKLGKDPKKVYCRGDWYNLQWMDEYTFSFDTEHAWSRPDEVEMLLKMKFPDIDLFFIEEESGMGIFQTNDTDGTYFPERVIIDFDDEREYYTEEDALVKLSGIKGTEIKDWFEAEDFVKEYNKQFDKDSEDYYTKSIQIQKADIYE